MISPDDHDRIVAHEMGVFEANEARNAAISLAMDEARALDFTQVMQESEDVHGRRLARLEVLRPHFYEDPEMDDLIDALNESHEAKLALRIVQAGIQPFLSGNQSPSRADLTRIVEAVDWVTKTDGITAVLARQINLRRAVESQRELRRAVPRTVVSTSLLLGGIVLARKAALSLADQEVKDVANSVYGQILFGLGMVGLSSWYVKRHGISMRVDEEIAAGREFIEIVDDSLCQQHRTVIEYYITTMKPQKQKKVLNLLGHFKFGK
ncbi:hypothetical protein KC959_03785 [Candidatus Saccharibacteria bacterium]|nr:hypothetical protein [Candidatus Saccharibacteria bacterium]